MKYWLLSVGRFNNLKGPLFTQSTFPHSEQLSQTSKTKTPSKKVTESMPETEWRLLIFMV